MSTKLTLDEFAEMLSDHTTDDLIEMLYNRMSDDDLKEMAAEREEADVHNCGVCEERQDKEYSTCCEECGLMTCEDCLNSAEVCVRCVEEQEEASLETCKCGLYQTCDICKMYQER